LLLLTLCACGASDRGPAGSSPNEPLAEAGLAGEPSAGDAGRAADDASYSLPSDSETANPSATTWDSPLSAASVLRKIKGTLTGLGPTDAEEAALQAGVSAEALKPLIDGWMATPEFQDRLLLFFQNAFQQSSLSVLDFQFQLRKRPGAFDLPYDIFGDDAFPSLFQNMKESFARTCLATIAAGRPFDEVLTTQRFMMTTALMSLYMQIEMPYDIHTLTFRFNQGRRPALADTLNPQSADYMVFGYAAPVTSSGRKFADNCAGDASKVSSYPGNTYIFQVLLGAVPRDSGDNSAGTTKLGCMEHASQPYFTPQDLSDWRMVEISSAGTPLLAYDLPGLRAASTLPSKLPRVSFFTTPAFLAVWNTNDSNQHRVTVNQALLAALGQGFTSASDIIPVPPTLTAVDGQHAVSTSSCYGCHKSLDPMRQFWGRFYDFNDKADGKKSSGAASFGFGNVAQDGKSLVDFGGLLGRVVDAQVSGQPVARFALAMAQKLCFFANSTQCEETDPELRRVALAFQEKYDFKTLVRELYSSPLVTSAADTLTAKQDGVLISVARRDQLCAALSARLKKPDLCEIAMPTPTNVTTPLNRLAGALPADGFSRGSEVPVTAPDPTLFYRAASELVCETIATKVVDATTGSVYTSASPNQAIEDMVTHLMGVPANDPKHAASVSALTQHFQAAMTTGKATATVALRSTFAAACQAPSTLALGI
jgi:hypothetical protein